MNENGFIYKLLYNLHTLSVWLLIFLAGAIVIHYKLPPSNSLVNGFIATEAYVRAWAQAQDDSGSAEQQRRQLAEKAEALLAQAKATGDAARWQPGYTLIANGFMPFLILIDMEGKVVHRWAIDTQSVWGNVSCTNVFRVAAPFADRAHILPGGDAIVQYGEHGSPYGCGIIRADRDGKVKWSFNALAHHDFLLDDKGGLYTLVQETVTGPQPGYEGLPYPISADIVVKLDENGKEEWRIPLLDAFRGTPYELALHRGKGDGDDEYDFMHTNSIDVLTPAMAGKFPMFRAGDILVSMRALGALAVIDGQSRKVKWATRGFWVYQHSASFLPNGRILLLDNQGQVDFGETYSRVLELDPATLAIGWNYTGGKANPFVTRKVGRVQRLPNGNTLILDSQHARVLEVTEKGETVWQYQMKKELPEDNYIDALYHAYRYTPGQLPFLQEK